MRPVAPYLKSFLPLCHPLMPSPSYTAASEALRMFHLLLRQTSSPINGRVCAHICLVLTKNDKPRGFRTSVVTESPPSLILSTHTPPSRCLGLSGSLLSLHSHKLFRSCENSVSKTFQEQLKAALFWLYYSAFFLSNLIIFKWFYKFELMDFFSLQRSIQSLTEFSKLPVFVDIYIKKTIKVMFFSVKSVYSPELFSLSVREEKRLSM